MKCVRDVEHSSTFLIRFANCNICEAPTTYVHLVNTVCSTFRTFHNHPLWQSSIGKLARISRMVVNQKRTSEKSDRVLLFWIKDNPCYPSPKLLILTQRMAVNWNNSSLLLSGTKLSAKPILNNHSLVLSSMQMRRARLIIIGKVCLAYGDNHFTHANFASRSQFCQTSNTSSA